MKTAKDRMKKAILFIANPRLLICFGLAWVITNGWSYILWGLGSFFNISWMAAVASGYIAFLWLPLSPEKIATAAIAVFLLRTLFPDDQKTLAILKSWYEKAKSKIVWKSWMQTHKQQRPQN